MNLLVIGEKYRKKLENSPYLADFHLFWLPENPKIDERLSSHADLSVFRYKNTVILADYLADSLLVNFLTRRGYEVKISNYQQGVEYPKDVNLCAAVLGNRIIHNERLSDELIKKLEIETLNVKQGYSRCSCLALSPNGIITSDKGIASIAERRNIEVLLISDDGITLEGYDRGFIGGASFLVENTVYFTGDIYKHINGKQIEKFISNHGFKICCLSDEILYDIGGAVYL